MKLGFIGTGKITESVISGIIKSSLQYSKISISLRNKKISKRLKKRFKTAVVINQQKKISDDKLIFLKAISNVVKSGMNIVGVSIPEKM